MNWANRRENELGYKHAPIVLKSDGEPAITAIVRAVEAKRLKAGLRTTVEQTPRYSSASLGAVGVQQRIMQGQTRALRAALEADMKCLVGPDHAMWPWMVRHAGNLYSRFTVGMDGKNAVLESERKSLQP